MDIEISGEYIELNKLLKFSDIADTGGIAGMLISSGEIKVDGIVETQKRKKVYPGQTVSYNDIAVNIVSKKEIS